MAKKRKKDSVAPDDLPQRFDVWQLAAEQIDSTVQVGDEALQPWMVVVASLTEGEVVFFELLHECPSEAEVREALRQAMLKPAQGDPHRPTKIQMRDEDWARALQPHLESLGVECETIAALDQIDEVLKGLISQLSELGQTQPGLLEMPGVTPEAVGCFFDAAAIFYEQAPWQKTGDRPIKVACAKFESGPWYAVLMGQGGLTCGLALYDDLQTVLTIQRGHLSEEESAQITASLTVVFGDKGDMLDGDLAAIEQHGWRVAEPMAYPVVFRMDPGLSMRPPLAWELELLEACLRGLPEFARKKTRRVEPLSVLVPASSGELSLVLSWAGDIPE